MPRPAPPRPTLRRAAALAGLAVLLLLAGPAQAAPPPRSPMGLTCSPQSDGVHLAWTAVSGVTSYNVWRRVGLNPTFVQIGTAATNSFVDHTAASGQLYHYAVSSVNGNGESPKSAPCDVLSVPVFPSALAVGAATVGGLGGAFLILRRRK